MNKKSGILLLGAALFLLFPFTAHAYIDPSVTSYAVQAIAGVVIALGVVIGVVWRRVKRGASKVLKIDENKNKEMEEDVQLNEVNKSGKSE